MKKTLTFLIVILFLLFFLPRNILAASSPTPNPCAGCTLADCNAVMECRGCPVCNEVRPSSPPDYPAENVTGKIVNPIFSDKLKTMPGNVFLSNFLKTGINLVFLIGSVIFFFMLTTGAVKWITAGSDKARLEGAQKQITHSLVGLALLFSVFAIINILERLFGVSLLNIKIPTL